MTGFETLRLLFLRCRVAGYGETIVEISRFYPHQKLCCNLLEIFHAEICHEIPFDNFVATLKAYHEFNTLPPEKPIKKYRMDSDAGLEKQRYRRRKKQAA